MAALRWCEAAVTSRSLGDTVIRIVSSSSSGGEELSHVMKLR